VAVTRRRKARAVASAAGWLLVIGVAAAFGGRGGLDWAMGRAVRDER
jgi:hypothetical protein